MTDLFDNLIDSFSAKELRTRVWGVVAAGFAVLAIAALGIVWLNRHDQRIEFRGMARWTGDTRLAIVLTSDELQRVADLAAIRIEVLDPAQGPVEAEARVVSIDPETATVQLDAPGLPPQLHALTQLDTRLIVVEKPYWKLLWGN